MLSQSVNRKSMKIFIIAFCLMASLSNQSVLALPQERQPDTASATEKNDLAGFNPGKQFQKQLLEFVRPMYQEPLVSSQMVVGLSKIDSSEIVSPARQLAADRINLSVSTMAELELQQRLSEQTTRMFTLRSQGAPVPGLGQIAAAAQSSAKTIANEAKSNELRSSLRLAETRDEVLFGERKLRAESRLRRVREMEIEPTVAQSGTALNVLLKSLKPILSRASSIENLDPAIGKLLNEQKISLTDIDRIQLRIENSGGPLIFSASQGSSDLGVPPMRMQHPDLQALVKEIESTLKKLRAESLQRSLLEEMEELTQKLDALDAKSEQVLGSPQENARKGSVQLRSYQQAKQYRARLRSMVNRMLLEGNTNVLRIPEGKFDLQSHGDRVFDFAKFVVDSGCTFAPANEGGALAYARMQRSMLELLGLLED